MQHDEANSEARRSGQAPSNLADLVRRARERSGQRPALIFRDQTLTWTDVDRQVDAVARGLTARGHRPGDRVAIALTNGPDFVRAYFGALRSGMVAVPVNPGYRSAELTHVLADSGASVLIATTDAAQEATAATAETPALKDIYVCDESREPDQPSLDDLAVDGDEPVASATSGDDLAVLLYTSGAEGRPKGAMMRHRNLLANLDQLDDIQPRVLGPTDVVLLALPLFHAYGLGPGLHAIAQHGCTGVLLERFDPDDALEQVHRHQVSCVLGVPQMYLAWSHLDGVAEAFASVRVATSGSAPLDETAHRRFAEATRHSVFEGYGLTETAPVLTSTLMSPTPKPGSVGRPIPGVEVKLVGLDGQTIELNEDDEDATPGTDPGEVWARGANLFSGYWPDGRDGPDQDGWWPTADLAYADADGDLFLVDRLRELVLVSGFNVYPREVEQVLCEHPAVAEAAVLGVPDERTGEAVKAYVVRHPAAEVTAEDLIAHCGQRLARFKQPSSIGFVSELPRSVTGKIRKSLLRDGLPQFRKDA
ncbi:MAG: AMP-binding protein, partial [Micromonosporaceae bacterium]